MDGFIYSAQRPFHPQRFWQLMKQDWLGVSRVKGFVWLASSMTHVGLWTWAEGVSLFRPAGFWWAAKPESDWPEGRAVRQEIRRCWHEKWGDRRQEIIFVGLEMDRTGFTAALDAALLSEPEMAQGAATDWACFADC